jgi:NAD(P)H-hydrate epimerase
MWIATVEQSRKIDRRAEEEFGIPSRVLMERAGWSVYEAVADLLRGSRGRLAVLCGRGNNGGDGFVVARLAHERGHAVECLVAGLEGDLGPACAEQMRIARAAGVVPIFADDARWERKLEALSCRDLIVDALLGTGIKSDVHGPIREAIQAVNRCGVPVVAVDIPSGIDGDTGEELGESIWALRTVTFGLPKPYLFQGTGLEHAGHWSVSDIGIPRALLSEPTPARLVENDWVASMLPERLRTSHKGTSGSVLIVAGSDRMPGAASLAVHAALRSGAGLVTVASVPSVCAKVSALHPEALLLPLPEVDGFMAPEAAGLILEAQARTHAAVFGPGLGQAESVRQFLGLVWRGWEKPCVVDADALNAVSDGVEPPASECVFTPHPGEMSRLLHSSIAEIQVDRFRTVAAAAEQFGQTVLLKGAYSVVAEASQPTMVNQTGNPGMATGGMGDVLSGVIGTLLAQDLPPYYAASCGMYWHGLAGDLTASEIASIGYTATDLTLRLPAARARICSPCDASPS